jgi:hypothetical protein
VPISHAVSVIPVSGNNTVLTSVLFIGYLPFVIRLVELSIWRITAKKTNDNQTSDGTAPRCTWLTPLATQISFYKGYATEVEENRSLFASVVASHRKADGLRFPPYRMVRLVPEGTRNFGAERYGTRREIGLYTTFLPDAPIRARCCAWKERQTLTGKVSFSLTARRDERIRAIPCPPAFKN